MIRKCHVFTVCIGVSLLMNLPDATLAQDFYKDKTIRVIVGQASGGGYDTHARTIARYLGSHIPGNPTVMVENMTGAGSLVAANYLYTNAKPDGLTLGVWNSAFVLNQALGDSNVRFDARKFGWIGAPSKGNTVCVVAGFVRLKTFEEILKSTKPIRLGGTAPGSLSVDIPMMLNKVVGTKFTIVSGYQGTAQTRLALQRHEVDGHCSSWESEVAARKNQSQAQGNDMFFPFLIHSRENDPELKNVPLFTEVLKDKSNIETYKAYISQMEYQRPFTVPPGTPKERLDILRRGFNETLADPEFLALASKLKLEITYVSGKEIDAIVSQVLSISSTVKENLQSLVQQ